MLDGIAPLTPYSYSLLEDQIEAQNTILLYKEVNNLDPLSVDDFLYAHKVLMQNLIADNGNLRAGNVGVFKGKELIYKAPPPEQVPGLIAKLFDFLKILTCRGCLRPAYFIMN